MENIVLGPFSFIISRGNLKKSNFVKNTIEKSINETKKLHVRYEVNVLEVTKSYIQNYFNYNFEIKVKTMGISEKRKLFEQKQKNIRERELETKEEIEQGFNTKALKKTVSRRELIDNLKDKHLKIILDIMKAPLTFTLSDAPQEAPELFEFYVSDRFRPKTSNNTIARFKQAGGTSYLTDPSKLREDDFKEDTYRDSFRLIEDSDEPLFDYLLKNNLLRIGSCLVLVMDESKVKDLFKWTVHNDIDYDLVYVVIDKRDGSTDINIHYTTYPEKDFKHELTDIDYSYNFLKDKLFSDSNDFPVGQYQCLICSSEESLAKDKYHFTKSGPDVPLSIFGMINALKKAERFFDSQLKKNTIDTYNLQLIYCTSTLNRDQLTLLLIKFYEKCDEYPSENCDTNNIFIELMQQLLGEHYSKINFEELLKENDIGKLATLSEKYTLETYQKIPIDKLLALLCYFVHCSILRMKYLHKFNINSSVSEQSKTSFMNYFNNAIEKGKDKTLTELSEVERNAIKICLTNSSWKELTIEQRRNAMFLGFVSDDFPKLDGDAKTKTLSDAEQVVKDAFNICLPSGEWNKWDNMTMDQWRSALMLGFADDDFPESDAKGKNKLFANMTAAEGAAVKSCLPGGQWKEWTNMTIGQLRSARILGFVSDDFPKSDGDAKTKTLSDAEQVEKEAFNSCLPSGEWKKWANMTMDELRSARILGFVSDDFPKSDGNAKTKDWANMSDAQRNACDDLGWTQLTWDGDDMTPLTAKQADLTIHQIKQAHLLGYTISNFKL